MRSLGILVSFLAAVIRTYRLGRIDEHRIFLVHHHAGHESHHIALDIFLGKHISEALFNQIADRALGLGNTEIHRHGLKVEDLLASLMLQHHIAHLRTIAMTDDKIITLFNDTDE